MTTLTPTPDTTPTTLLELVTKHKERTSLNKVHNSVVDLSKVTTLDILPNNLRAKMLEDIMAYGPQSHHHPMLLSYRQRHDVTSLNFQGRWRPTQPLHQILWSFYIQRICHPCKKSPQIYPHN